MVVVSTTLELIALVCNKLSFVMIDTQNDEFHIIQD